MMFVILSPKRWFQFNSRIVRTHFSSIMNLNNWKMIGETRSHMWRTTCTWREDIWKYKWLLYSKHTPLLTKKPESYASPFSPTILLTFRLTSNPLCSSVLLRVVRVNCRLTPFKTSFSSRRWSHNDTSEPSSNSAYVSVIRPLHKPWTRTGMTRRQTRFLPDAVADAWCESAL